VSPHASFSVCCKVQAMNRDPVLKHFRRDLYCLCHPTVEKEVFFRSSIVSAPFWFEECHEFGDIL
jgi:hypothetical protein